jgi:hypothetical protein
VSGLPPLDSPDCRYWLGRETAPGKVDLVDGCHDGPEGVAQAAKLFSRIFRDEGPWVMVEIHPMPDLDPPINEDAARDCAYLIDEFGPSRGGGE